MCRSRAISVPATSPAYEPLDADIVAARLRGRAVGRLAPLAVEVDPTSLGDDGSGTPEQQDPTYGTPVDPTYGV
jgi:hypothetical protein